MKFKKRASYKRRSVYTVRVIGPMTGGFDGGEYVNVESRATMTVNLKSGEKETAVNGSVDAL